VSCKIAFRIDASETVGFGHLSRCINLAEELRNRGCDILFVTREDALKSHKALENRLFETVLLPAPEIPGIPHENSSSLSSRSTTTVFQTIRRCEEGMDLSTSLTSPEVHIGF